MVRNRLLKVHDVFWKFRFRKYNRFDSDMSSKKKNVVFGFENTHDGVFQLINVFIFALKSVTKAFVPLNGNLRVETEKLEILTRNSYLRCSKKMNSSWYLLSESSWICVQVKKSNFSKVAGIQLATLRKTGLLHVYFWTDFIYIWIQL